MLFWRTPPPLSLVVAPCGEQLGGKLIVGISDYLANEGELTLRYLVADRRNVEEPLTNGRIRDSFVDYSGDINLEDFPDVSVKKNF